MKRSGIADLPLHGGRVPAWLAERMVRLGTAISECVMYHYGTSEFLSRLSDPYWFQALGCVLGMDWHSSGITTSVLGALKRGLNPRASELGVYVCGGRGRHSRRTPDELRSFADRTSLVRGRFGGRHKSPRMRSRLASADDYVGPSIELVWGACDGRNSIQRSSRRNLQSNMLYMPNRCRLFSSQRGHSVPVRTTATR